MAEQDVENELLDYDEDEEPQAPQESTPAPPKKDVKGSYVSIHSSGFRDFLLKPELLRAIVDCGFEHPSEGMLPASPPLGPLPTVSPPGASPVPWRGVCPPHESVTSAASMQANGWGLAVLTYGSGVCREAEPVS